MERLHFEDDEPTGTPVCDFDFDFELFSLKIPEYKELIFEEIKLYHSQEAVEEYERIKTRLPKGHLHTRYPKERLRTMYKQDPTILAIYNNLRSDAAAAKSTSATEEAKTATPSARTEASSNAAASSTTQWAQASFFAPFQGDPLKFIACSSQRTHYALILHLCSWYACKKEMI